MGGQVLGFLCLSCLSLHVQTVFMCVRVFRTGNSTWRENYTSRIECCMQMTGESFTTPKTHCTESKLDYHCRPSSPITLPVIDDWGRSVSLCVDVICCGFCFAEFQTTISRRRFLFCIILIDDVVSYQCFLHSFKTMSISSEQTSFSSWKYVSFLFLASYAAVLIFLWIWALS